MYDLIIFEHRLLTQTLTVRGRADDGYVVVTDIGFAVGRNGLIFSAAIFTSRDGGCLCVLGVCASI